MTDLSGWPALVLTAGKATRLRPLSSIRAKAAMPVAGKPIVVRILAWLRAAGVRHVVLNLHHRPETITRVVGDGSAFGVRVRYSWERDVLGSAGGPRRALPLLEADRFLIVNGDTLTDCDLGALVERHATAQALVTMAVVTGDVERYGGVVVGPDGLVQGFAKAREVAERRSAGSEIFHFIGVQAADARVFAPLADDAPSEIVQTVYPKLIREQPASVAAFLSNAEFLDVGTARDYLDTVARVAAREQQPFDVGEDCDIAVDARLTKTVLWDRVNIGRGAQLSNCIVSDDVDVEDGSRYQNCVLIANPDGLLVTPL
jgi:NDP-sugar pyrophosphorylase family protein